MHQLHRFFIRPESVSDGKISIEGPDARQIATVLRLQPGSKIMALDGTGSAHIVELSEVSSTLVTGSIVQTCPLDSEPQTKLTIAQALPKGDKLEFILQKGTELGVVQFEIIETARTVARPPENRLERRFERWRSIVEEAAEQACRSFVPEVSGIDTLEQFLPKISSYDLSICLWEDENHTGIRNLLQQGRSAQSILIMVGPEGGFDKEEISRIQKAGAVTASLGKRILRCETAAIAATAIVLYELES
jgi:16S rRNA (uracil1498-N3)-methyltransferase